MLLTEEDTKAVKAYLLIPVAIDTLTLNIDKLLKADLKLPELFIGQLDVIRSALLKQHIEVKKTLRKLGVKVHTERKEKHGIFAEYKCRGYDHKMELHSSLIRADLMVMFSEVIGVNLEKINPNLFTYK
jgi:hypothetical protein